MQILGDPTRHNKYDISRRYESYFIKAALKIPTKPFGKKNFYVYMLDQREMLESPDYVTNDNLAQSVLAATYKEAKRKSEEDSIQHNDFVRNLVGKKKISMDEEDGYYEVFQPSKAWRRDALE